MFKQLIHIFTGILMIKSSALANPFVEAGGRYSIDPWLLYSIAKHESALNPRAIHKNRNGSYDMGIMQINSVHLPELAKYGISEEHLMTPELNIYIGAYYLAKCVKKHGYTTKALGCYNGDGTGVYAQKVLNIFNKETRRYALAQE